MLFHKGKIIVYGGICNKGLDDDQIYQYTIENRQWKIIKFLGDSPGKRFFHSFNIFNENSLLIFGGKITKGEKEFESTSDIILINMDNLKCEKISTISTIPRFGHGCCINTTLSPVIYWILGGSNDDGLTTFDVHFLSQIGFIFFNYKEILNEFEKKRESIEEILNEENLSLILKYNENIKILENDANKLQFQM